jgi:hypothetical protein
MIGWQPQDLNLPAQAVFLDSGREKRYTAVAHQRGSASYLSSRLFEASICRNLSEFSNKADNHVTGGRSPRNTKYFKFFQSARKLLKISIPAEKESRILNINLFY